MSANIKTKCIKVKETVKVIMKFCTINLISLLFFNNENNKIGPIPHQRIYNMYTQCQLSYLQKNFNKRIG